MAKRQMAGAGGLARFFYRSAVGQRLSPLLAGLYRQALRLRARDITAFCESRSALVLAPHPDDEAIGCGVTISRKVECGAAVRVVFATDGRHSHRSQHLSPDDLARLRHQEALASCRTLGLADSRVVFLDYRDRSLAENLDELTERLRALIACHRPEDIFTPSAIDTNPDHWALNAATRRAVEDGVCRPRIYEYPIWFWDPKAWIDPDVRALRMTSQLAMRPLAALFTLHPVIVRSDGHIERKREAILAHRSQTENITGEPGWRTLDRNMLDAFLAPYELFFVLNETSAGHRSSAAR